MNYGRNNVYRNPCRETHSVQKVTKGNKEANQRIFTCLHDKTSKISKTRIHNWLLCSRKHSKYLNENTPPKAWNHAVEARGCPCSKPKQASWLSNHDYFSWGRWGAIVYQRTVWFVGTLFFSLHTRNPTTKFETKFTPQICKFVSAEGI